MQLNKAILNQRKRNYITNFEEINRNTFLETLFSRYSVVIEEETCYLNPSNRAVNHGVSLIKLV